MRLFNHKAFTLLEVLIAVGIFAMTVVTIMAQVQKANQISIEDEVQVQLMILAQQKMTEVEQELKRDMIRGKFPDEQSESGSFKDDFKDYKWNYQIRKVEIPVNTEKSDQESAAYSNTLKRGLQDLSDAVRELKVSVTYTNVDEDDLPKSDAQPVVVGQKTEEGDRYTLTLTTHIVNLDAKINFGI